MSLYARRRTVIEVADDAEFAHLRAKWESQVPTMGPNAFWEITVDSSPGPGGTDLDLKSFFATILEITVHNNGPNLVTVTWTGSAGALTQTVSPGEQMTITDATVAAAVHLIGVASQCRVIAMGT